MLPRHGPDTASGCEAVGPGGLATKTSRTARRRRASPNSGSGLAGSKYNDRYGQGALTVVKTGTMLHRSDARRMRPLVRFRSVGAKSGPSIMIKHRFLSIVAGNAGGEFSVSHSYRSISPGGA